MVVLLLLHVPLDAPPEIPWPADVLPVCTEAGPVILHDGGANAIVLLALNSANAPTKDECIVFFIMMFFCWKCFTFFIILKIYVLYFLCEGKCRRQ
jgi:hypothetical protein